MDIDKIFFCRVITLWVFRGRGMIDAEQMGKMKEKVSSNLLTLLGYNLHFSFLIDICWSCSNCYGC
jgi:hypothetical protein